MDDKKQYRNFLGLRFKSKEENINKSKILAPIEDGSTIVEAVGPVLKSGLWNSNFVFTDEIELIKRFRDMSLNVYCNRAINEIVNSCISFEDEEGCSISINIDKLEYGDKTKKLMQECWDDVLDLLNFRNDGQVIFRDWFIDGRIFYQKIVDKNNLDKGIIEVRRLDSLDVKKIKQIEKKYDVESGALIIEQEQDYYLFNPEFTNSFSSGQQILLNPDAIAFATSGLYIYKKEAANNSKYTTRYNDNNRYVVSYLYPMIKPLNQLNIVEEAGLINLVSRAPERRVHYVDVAGLPKSKADVAMKDYANALKNNTQYNSETGTFNTETNMLSMQDDLIIPRRNGVNTAEVTTLSGVNTNNNIDIITHFKKKFYMASHVALSRMNDESNSFLGRASEINRDELNMSKFCNNLRMKFLELPFDLWRTQMILKNVIEPTDWNYIRNNVIAKFSSDSVISQLRNIELLQEKVAALRAADAYVDKYFSKKYINKHILGFSDEEIDTIKKDIELENSDNGNEVKNLEDIITKK